MSSLAQYCVHLVPCLSKSSMVLSLSFFGPRMSLIVLLPLVSFMSPNRISFLDASERSVDACFLSSCASSLLMTA